MGLMDHGLPAPLIDTGSEVIIRKYVHKNNRQESPS